MVEVVLIQDSILDFPKSTHILSISYWKYHFWISVYFFICKLIGWWRRNMTILQVNWLVTSWHDHFEIQEYTLKSKIDILNG